VEKIGEKIKLIRDHFNLSQDRFGKKLGLSGKTISSYENHKATPPLHILEKISETYNVKILEVSSDYRSEIELELNKMAEFIDSMREMFRNGLSL